MPEPLSTGRTWIDDPDGNHVAAPGISFTRWVHDKADPAHRAIFKWPEKAEAIYSIAMERVAYVLADGLGLPVPATYLETLGNQAGAIQLRVDPSRTWKQARASPTHWNDVVNQDDWAMSVVFDVWIANVDRHEHNILLEGLPVGTPLHRALKSKLWLIDNGISGLWFPSKFDLALGGTMDVELVHVGDGSIVPEASNRLRNYMPRRYRQAFATHASAASRRPLLARIEAVTDDAIEGAVQEVPAEYMSARAAELTVDLLRMRRARIEKVVEDVFHL